MRSNIIQKKDLWSSYMLQTWGIIVGENFPLYAIQEISFVL